MFPGDLLWYSRWNEILELGPRFVEIITWNDYGESHYTGPLDSMHYDDGNSKWTNDMYYPFAENGFQDLFADLVQAARRLA